MNTPMRSRFWLLLLATILVVIGAAWLMSRKSGSSESLSEQWLPGLRADLERVKSIRIIGAGNKRVVTLERDATGFVVVERGRYPADTATLRTLLLQLADARRVEAKTARPESHASLGVESVASATATGAQVEIDGLAKPLVFTVGRTAEQLGGGTFVRSAEDKQSWLVSGNIVIEREPQRWLEKRIADIAPARIERIDVQSGGESFALLRAADDRPDQSDGSDANVEAEEAADDGKDGGASDDAFVLAGASAAEMASPFAGAATAGALSELDLADVHPRDKKGPPKTGATMLHFRLRNGVTVAATAWQKDGKTLLQLNATATPAAPQISATSTEHASTIDVAGADGRASTPEKAAEAAAVVSASADAAVVAPAVAAFNRQWQAWTFELPPHRSAAFLPKREALLKSAETP